MKPIIEIDSLSKKYRITHQPGGYLSLREKLLTAFTFENKSKEDFWALKDLNFRVSEGESLGIIGRNGAGKSTLLKILSKITPPTKGRIIRRGRVASLLEVGTGFHPELTGRENIFFNGSLLGMRHREILEKFDQIVDFSGVERFLDTPLKHYSSGMQLRLAFGVAAFLEPEILVIDEVLAVGDAEFQKKCIGKMEDVSKSGRTILFVSHNMAAVRSLCNKALLLDKGEVKYEGTAESTIEHYISLSVPEKEKGVPGYFDLANHSGKKDPAKGIVAARLMRNGNTADLFFPGEPFQAEFDFKDETAIREIVFGIVIKDGNQNPLLGINNWDMGVRLNQGPVKRGTVVFKIESLPFYASSLFYIDLYFGDGGNNYDVIENAVTFRVEANDVFGNGKVLNTRLNTVFPGTINMSCH